MPLDLTTMVSGLILSQTQQVHHLILIYALRIILLENSQTMLLIQMEGMVFVSSTSLSPEHTHAWI
jgi:hypothetical protein